MTMDMKRENKVLLVNIGGTFAAWSSAFLAVLTIAQIGGCCAHYRLEQASTLDYWPIFIIIMLEGFSATLAITAGIVSNHLFDYAGDIRKGRRD